MDWFGVAVLCAVALAVGMVTAPFWVTALPWWKLTKPSLEANQIMLLMQMYPHEWQVDSYMAVHQGAGVWVWIANRDYGLRWADTHDRCLSSQPREEKADRMHVWRAFKQMQRGSHGLTPLAMKIDRYLMDGR